MNYDYRHILRAEFERRTSTNTSYSLRAFARDLQIPAPQLSAVFLGKKGLSKKRALAVAKALEFSKIEEKRFVMAVVATHARSQAEREEALKKILRLSEMDKIATIETAKFEVVADWYHLAILQLMETTDFSWDVEAIAKKLDIPVKNVKNAIDALVLSRLLKPTKDGYQKTKEFIRTEDVPSRAIRSNLQQMIAKASDALEHQPIDERDFSSVTVAIDPNRMSEMKQWLREFRETFCVKAAEGELRTDVYALNLQFFRLSRSISKKEKPK